jgi:hypothetical protein
VENAAQCAAANLAVVGHDNSGRRIIAPQNHVVAALTAKDKRDFLQRGANLPPRQIR